jgi:hypothetical protein
MRDLVAADSGYSAAAAIYLQLCLVREEAGACINLAAVACDDGRWADAQNLLGRAQSLYAEAGSLLDLPTINRNAGVAAGGSTGIEESRTALQAGQGGIYPGGAVA